MVNFPSHFFRLASRRLRATHACNDKVIAQTAGGLGGTVSPLAGPGQSPGSLAGVEGAEPPEAVKIVPFLRA